MITPRPTEIDRQRIVQHALEAFKKLRDSRHYAADDSAVLALGALGAAFAERNKETGNKSFNPADLTSKVFEPLAKVVPGLGLTQAKPGPEPEPPKPWTDPVTGEVARNPFKQPKDFKSIALLEKLDPLLAEHLKATAEGVTYAKLAELQDEKAKRERQRAIIYGEKEHAENPFWMNKLTGKMEFEKNSDPITLEFYKSEAKPVVIDFGNLTHGMALTKNDPTLRELWTRAGAIAASWQADDRRALEALQRDAEQKLAAFRKVA